MPSSEGTSQEPGPLHAAHPICRRLFHALHVSASRTLEAAQSYTCIHLVVISRIDILFICAFIVKRGIQTRKLGPSGASVSGSLCRKKIFRPYMLHTQELSSTEARTSARGAPPHAALQAHRDDRMPRSGSVGAADASRPHASRKSDRSISFPTAPASMFAMALSISASVLASMLSLHASLSEPLPEGASRFPGAISPSVMASMMRAFPFLQHLPC